MNFWKRFCKWFLRKFFRKERREFPEDITSAFLRSASRLAKKGKVTMFRGGQRAFLDALMDPDKITYILTISIQKSRRRVEDKRWFEEYTKKERELL